MDQLDAIALAFFEGNLDALRIYRCPKCQGQLLFSPVINRGSGSASDGGIKEKARMGLSVYCTHQCNIMLIHLDGWCPAWALEIEDWEQFNRDLYAPS